MTDQEKIIYDILCSDEQPPEGQHWEGFVTNKIVVALAQPESPYETGARLFIEGKGISFIATAVPTDADIAEALRGFEDARLAQPAQKPVNWMKECADFWNRYIYINEMAQEKYEEEAQMWLKKLRTSLPQREWVGLTDAEREEATGWSVEHIEAKLKEKNT